ncbi:MAG: PHP domain-containing protein [Coriobacteriia bacterium]|nr:PHP domain-containing protein [Coriobacteriia bacterium]
MSTEVWSKADLHIHSTHSDGTGKIPEIMEYVATRTDLKVIAITDHNTIEGALFAKELEEIYGVEVVVGEEVSSTEGHILGLFLSEEIPQGLTPFETIRMISDQGGIAIIPHPFSRRGVFGPFGRSSFVAAISELAFHAVEIYNSVPYLGWANRVAAKMFHGGQGIAAVGGSDAHMVHGIGRGYTLFRGTTAEDLRKSINELETRAEADRGGIAVALRYMRSIPQIRRLQVANWERCKVRI